MGSLTKDKSPWYLSRRMVILGLVIVGPFALPLVWLSPKFSLKWKWLVSVLTVIMTVLTLKFSAIALSSIQQQLKDLKELSGT